MRGKDGIARKEERTDPKWGHLCDPAVITGSYPLGSGTLSDQASGVKTGRPPPSPSKPPASGWREEAIRTLLPRAQRISLTTEINPPEAM
ncbi:hypothetical protein B5K05_18700 [Rhizobium phaseoli]|nr:hypothetical protein B5K05_18700 [Rhizobium phaseoli]